MVPERKKIETRVRRVTQRLSWMGIAATIGLISIALELHSREATASSTPSMSVVAIGDSHSAQSYGYILNRELRTNRGTSNLKPLQVQFFGRCGSSANWWLTGRTTHCGAYTHSDDIGPIKTAVADTPIVSDLINQYRPAWMVISLGANHFPSTSERTRRQVSELVNEIVREGIRCIWVGPPRGRNKTEPRMSELYSDLQAATHGRCAFIDSRPLTWYPAEGGDGAHFDTLPNGLGEKIAGRWAVAVATQVKALIAQGGYWSTF